jgi:hypothetical protein
MPALFSLHIFADPIPVIDNQNWINDRGITTLLSVNEIYREEEIMATLTITSPPQVNGTSYAQNVGRAARALLDAILSFRSDTQEVAAPIVRSAKEERAQAHDNVSLFRLYTLAAPYDSVMPNLKQELDLIAGRGE